MRVVALLLSLVMLGGCVDVAKQLKEAKMEVKTELKAEINAEMNNTMENKIQSVVGGKIEEVKKSTRVDVDTRLEQAEQTFNQKIGVLKGSQNTGIMSGGAIYVLVLSVVVVLALVSGIVAVVAIIRNSRKGKVLSSVMAGVNKANNAALVDHIQSAADEAGVGMAVNKLMVSRGMVR